MQASSPNAMDKVLRLDRISCAVLSRMQASSPNAMDKVLRLDRINFESALTRAVQVLKNGGVIALPTDTVYGITSLLSHSDKLYKIKRRNPEKPLGLFVADVQQVGKWATRTVDMQTLRRLLPGPVTLVFDRSVNLPATFNTSTRKVGIRIPENRFVQELCARLDEPLAQTSANVSGCSSPLNVQEFSGLWNELDLILDAGTIGAEQGDHKREGSTVVDLTLDGTYSIIRDGSARMATEEILRDSGLTATADFPF
uniref:Threonylcarbamoyl-AMP synthase n=1 Tax=Steinernema glaseri TaxID=37863 RepID=A0A1I8ANQ0_9BILA